jgi:hypothetical protein
MDHFFSIIPAIAGLVGTQIIFSLLRKSKFFRDASTSGFKFTYETSKFNKWYFIQLISLLSLSGIFAYIFYEFSIYFYFYKLHIDNYIFLITPQKATFGLPAFFLGLIFANNILDILFRIILSINFLTQLDEWIDRLYQINQKRLNLILQIIILPIGIFTYILIFDYYAKITNNHFIISKFFSLGEIKYNIKDINKLEVFFPNSSETSDKKRHKYYIIHFNNGDSFNFQLVNHDKTINQQMEILQYLINQTGLQITINDKKHNL